MSTTTRESLVKIPGALYATYADGKVTGFSFTIAANDAGYFGQSAILLTGDNGLDVTDEDGPFWTAVGEALAAEMPIEIE